MRPIGNNTFNPPFAPGPQTSNIAPQPLLNPLPPCSQSLPNLPQLKHIHFDNTDILIGPTVNDSAGFLALGLEVDETAPFLATEPRDF